jgi:hypothetical protein
LCAAGNSAIISSKLSFKIVTISSASSKTRNLVSFRIITLRCIKSIKRPGCYHDVCGVAKRSICGFMGIPPQVAAIETSGRYFAKSSRFLKNLLP